METESNESGNMTESHSDSSDVVKSVLIGFGIILGTSLLLIIIRLVTLGPYYRKKTRIDGKVIIVTGCNTGIGKETVLDLAKRGGKIYMACRDSAKCEAARLEIIKKSKNENVFNRILDLGSLESIKKFVDKFLEEESRLDILINNAGIMATPKGYTKDGFEQQIGVNHLGHFYLTNLLLDTIKKSAPSRIVVVSSALYAVGNIKKDDFNSEKSYSPFGAYCQSKLANVLFTKYLSKKLCGTGVTVNCLHPGVVRTELTRYMLNHLAERILSPLRAYFFKTARSGAQTSIRLAIDPSLNDVSGHYYFDSYFRFPILPKGRDPEMAKWLWDISDDMIKSRINEKVVDDLSSTSGSA